MQAHPVHLLPPRPAPTKERRRPCHAASSFLNFFSFSQQKGGTASKLTFRTKFSSIWRGVLWSHCLAALKFEVYKSENPSHQGTSRKCFLWKMSPRVGESHRNRIGENFLLVPGRHFCLAAPLTKDRRFKFNRSRLCPLCPPKLDLPHTKISLN